MVFAYFGQRSRRRSADRAQQVVLACAIFDPDGKLMVTPEGLLPSRKITDAFYERVRTFLQMPNLRLTQGTVIRRRV